MGSKSCDENDGKLTSLALKYKSFKELAVGETGESCRLSR